MLFSLPPGTKMFQFPGLAPCIQYRVTVLQTDGLSHSEIRASRDICSYTRLIAAYHVLHRLCEPRHPPYALTLLRHKTPNIRFSQKTTSANAGQPILSAVNATVPHKRHGCDRNRSFSILIENKTLSSSLQSCLCQHVKYRRSRNTRHRVGFRIGCAYPVLT